MKKTIFIAMAMVVLLAANALAQNLILTSSSYDPAPALPGKTLKLTVTIKNDSGAEAKNAVFELDLTGARSRETGYPFSLGSGVSPLVEMGTIKGGQSATARFDIQIDPNALNGDYRISAAYGEKDLPKKTTAITISILSRKPQIEIIQSDIAELAAGQTTTISVIVANVGSDNAREILIGFAEDRTVTSTGIVVERNIIPIGSAYQFIASLKPGEQQRVNFSVATNPEATLKTYMMPVTLKFKDENFTAYTETRYLGLKLVQEAELDTVINSVQPAAFAGGTSEISFDLFNTGIGPAKFVVAKPSAEIGKFENEKIFVGTLEADDYDSFKTKLSIAPATEPGLHPIKIALEFKDQYGATRQLEKQLMLNVVSAAEAQAASPLLVAIGIIGLILQIIGLVFVARLVYRRIKKMRK